MIMFYRLAGRWYDYPIFRFWKDSFYNNDFERYEIRVFNAGLIIY